MNARLSALRQAGVLSALDEQLALTLTRLAGESDERVLLGAALVARQVSHGHVCLPLPRLCAGELPMEVVAGDTLAPWPELDDWLHALRHSALVESAQGSTPLVLDAAGRLYLRRYFQHERQLAQELRTRVCAARPALDAGLLRAGLDRLFGSAEPLTDLQRMAAQFAVTRPFVVISGGPGTGKTSTVVKMLALAIEQAQAAGAPLPRIQLMAPTGKAAARMAESIRKWKPALDCAECVRAAIPDSATTIHRALGAIRNDRNREVGEEPKQLSTDLVLVDEASMVDLALMARLMTAIPAHARVVLLGDKHQLASVEAGAVLGDICGAGLSDTERAVAPELADCVVQLTRSYRYTAGSGIGELAKAINAGKAERALEVLASARYPDVALCDEPVARGLGPTLTADVVRGYESYLRAADPLQALQLFDRFRVLCAHRRGLRGVERLNRAIAELLLDQGLVERSDGHFKGRPVLITQNDYRNQLWNGDIGIVHDHRDALALASFVSPQGTLRTLGAARLPPHESAFAMSIHKSQGSEVDELAVVLPEEPSAIVTRELLYTAVTRARRRVVIHASPRIVALAIDTTISRSSGLREALYGK